MESEATKKKLRFRQFFDLALCTLDLIIVMYPLTGGIGSSSFRKWLSYRQVPFIQILL